MRVVGKRRRVGFGERHPRVLRRPNRSQRRRNIIDNNLDQAKGRVKQAVGDLTDNKDLKKQGKADENAGKVKEFLEDTKDKAEDLVDKVKDRATKN